MRSPIHIVAPNPTFDTTYRLPRIELGEANRVTDVTRISGGKGLNTARVLADLGIEASVGGFVGGPRAQEFLAGVGNVEAYFTLIDAPLRSTVSVIDQTGSTSFNEAGPHVSAADVESLIEATLDLLESFGTRAVLSLNGSNPPGTPIEAYSFLIARAREAGHIVEVDTSGDYLLAAAAAGAHVLKPNEHELLAATGGGHHRRGHLDVVGARGRPHPPLAGRCRAAMAHARPPPCPRPTAL
ncbi:hypothetical protein BSZ39_03030 [Bowdeniella nasicola]|uniref:Carbohydrate kinase PfkB domain-containing protein n=1 Tax=Bowdeniella nasicola TaxID=208480 RepID=A0A1Q5Q4B6_9ACTO|nr:PfkB family carbohydrate kinase [Bowdeniella nasicola]OKL54674.1 hypothetical protein BSZ39_03030 [Bowdeniella nasicola]